MQAAASLPKICAALAVTVIDPGAADPARHRGRAYALAAGKVHASNFGHEWFDPLAEPDFEPLGSGVGAMLPGECIGWLL